MVKEVGHDGGAMGWRGGREVVISGSSRRYQWEKKNQRRQQAAGKGYSLVKRLRFTALICNYLFYFILFYYFFL